MSASVHTFRSKRARLNARQAEETRQFLLDFGEEHRLPEEALGRVIAAIDAEMVSYCTTSRYLAGAPDSQAAS